jgi:hypothetical protein
MCKTMERIINKRLLHVIEEKRLLYPPTALISLDSLISEAIRKKEYRALLSLGISKAYDMSDTCWRYGILRKLKHWKKDGRILQFIENFMSNQKLRVAVGNYF